MAYDLTIIGGGPAGLTASIYASRAGIKPVIFEKLFVGGQMANTDEIDNYPGFESIAGTDLIFKMNAHAKKFGGEVISEEVLSITTDGPMKVLKTAKQVYQTKAVILTTGALPRKLGIPGEAELSGRGVSYCATCDGAFYRGKAVAIIGGGNTAVEDAIFLSRFCSQVYLVHRRDQYRADTYMVNQLKQYPSITQVLSSAPVRIQGKDRVEELVVSQLTTGEEKTLEVSGVFIAVGSIPNTAFLGEAINRNENGAIITNEKMETNLPGVFAAGDARNTPLRQVITAAADGAVAAVSASAYLIHK